MEKEPRAALSRKPGQRATHVQLKEDPKKVTEINPSSTRCVFQKEFGIATGFSGRGQLEPLFAYGCDEDLSAMGSSPVFKQKNALPRTKQQFAIHNRYGFTGACQDHTDV